MAISEFDPPDPDMLTSLVIVRRNRRGSSARGGVDNFANNTVRRAAVPSGGVTPQTQHGQVGSTATARVILGPPNPLVKTEDQIAVLPRIEGDPDPSDRTPGDCWVDETTGKVKRAVTGGDIEVLGSVPAGTSDIVEVTGPLLDDIRAPRILVVEGPAVDLGDQGVAYRVECGEPG